jgi:curli production assembly/transport component CsgG
MAANRQLLYPISEAAMKKLATLLISILLVLILPSCSQYLSQPVKISKAKLGAETPHYMQLTALPKPKEKIVAAVYKFRDQTGQYKDTEAGTSWSTAVTQGATSILLRAMEESGWFIPIEREGLSNLLNERKIIRSSLANYGEKEQDQGLPPLVFAGLILEGGIISFDSNIMTGGVGARYFGTGGSSQYREDRVTIYLRAVSTSNGRILKTVYTSKTILSQQIDVGIFRFVSTRRLLEAETGFTYNEPGEMAVKEAIEKAVSSLVIEGIIDNLWKAENETVINSELIKQYASEKELSKNTDAFGATMIDRRGKFGVGVRSIGSVYEGDYTGRKLYPGGEINVELFANRKLSGSIAGGMFEAGTAEEFQATLGYLDAGIRYKFFHRMRSTPYVRIGAGVVSELKNNSSASDAGLEKNYPMLSTELGIEFLVTKRFGINSSAYYRFLSTDSFDRLTYGKYNDSLWGLQFGVMWYMTKK